MKELRKDIENVLDDAFKLGDGNSSVASAYYLEAIAKMMYVQMFHEEYVRDYESSNIGHIAEEEEEQDEVSESTDI